MTASSHSPANPVLVTVTRNDLVESIHRGAVCVVDENNRILHQAGDIHRVTYTRSAMKFIQALPLIESGAADHFGITDEELAVICASHNAEDAHLEAVRGILAKGGIPESALGCGAHRPFHGPAADILIQVGLRPTPLHNNCSGKHSGFLLLSKFLGAPLENYLDPTHPAQQLVRKAASEMFELPPEQLHPGTDGCSAPNFALPLFNHAVGFKNFCTSKPGNPLREAACKRVIRAITSHPFMVAGSQRFCTDLMRETNGEVIGKVGAEGVYGMAIVKERIGIAIKVDDGAMGPQYNVAVALLEKFHALSPAAAQALEHYKKQPIYNFMKKLTGYREGFTG